MPAAIPLVIAGLAAAGSTAAAAAPAAASIGAIAPATAATAGAIGTGVAGAATAAGKLIPGQQPNIPKIPATLSTSQPSGQTDLSSIFANSQPTGLSGSITPPSPTGGGGGGGGGTVFGNLQSVPNFSSGSGPSFGSQSMDPQLAQLFAQIFGGGQS